MPYYIVSFNQAFKKHRERFSHLKEVRWAEQSSEVNKILLDFPAGAVFFIEFSGDRELKDGFVLSLRESGKALSVIYVTDHNATQDIKAHQLTPAGADGYYSVDEDQTALARLLTDLQGNEQGKESGPPEIKAGEAFELDLLKKLKNHPMSSKIDNLFNGVITKKSAQPAWMRNNKLTINGMQAEPGVKMSAENKKDELSLDEEFGEFQLEELTDSVESANQSLPEDGLDLNLDDEINLEFGDDELTLNENEDSEAPLSLEDISIENLGELDFGNLDSPNSEPSSVETATQLDPLSNDFSLSSMEDPFAVSLTEEDNEVSEDVKEKLKEIDAIMDGSSRIDLKAPSTDADPDVALVSDDLDLESLDFSREEEPVAAALVAKSLRKPLAVDDEDEDSGPVVTVQPKRKKKEVRESHSEENIRDISGAYAGDLERTQMTISNLRADRDELLTRIQVLEDEKVLHNRQSLTMRAELDEKKIELSIIRRKMNEEISELKDKMRIHEERRLILEEKNRILLQEVEKAGQKNKMDVKKVQMRERELEQRLELLKSDSETQIRNRDLKILELKRKIDAMEFDMESITTQEKRSVESRFELEDKLDKAIRTLRSAITVLEEEGDNGRPETFKKNIDI